MNIKFLLAPNRRLCNSRQKSILSFFQKSSSESQSSDDSSYTDTLSRQHLVQFPRNQLKLNSSKSEQSNAPPSAKDPWSEVRGTDTPPEKLPRRIFSTDLPANDDSRPSLFSSILHKFARVDERESSRDRNQANGGSAGSYSTNIKIGDCQKLALQGAPSQHSRKDNPSNSSVTYRGDVAHVESAPDILGPETPAMRPLVPRLKRIQEDSSNLEEKNDSSLFDPNKRVKLLQDSETANKNHRQASEMTTSKFEWLDPSLMRDAKGRRPGDALYDKRTLYIPPDALKKMSASQKQYWSVKCQYMDVVLFFKVGKFYELYELDAEIGHKELDWKMTFSGVGKCRQVGISESGIDDAVQKLLARGYKVGRIEQIETSNQAKARGATSVIQRKLVHVMTPSTVVDGSIGPEAVHLLALKRGTGGLENGSVVYGFAFVDCATLKFWVGLIHDDASCAALGALLMQVSPKEVIYEDTGLSREAQKALKKYSVAGSTKLHLTPMASITNFVDESEVRKLIQNKGYFKGSTKLWDSVLDGGVHHDLTICALGGLVGNLSRLKLDDVLCNGDVLPYQVYKGCLRMDGQTLVNLEIFSNNADGGQSGTLYKYLDNCTTSSGKRLLRSWICHPLRDVGDIDSRLNVVEELVTHSEITSLVAQYLRKIPDIERLLGRVKATVGSSASLLLPMVGEKVLKQRDHDVTESDAETLSLLVELFIEKDTEWSQVIHALNCIDVLQSFAVAANSSCGSMCRPVVLPANSRSVTACRDIGAPVLKIRGLWHPYALGESGATLVPNDVHLGEDTNGYCPQALLLTGPNMGGKSTLLRATCLAVILAQLGCYVPCEMCVMSPADIIFTRLGATDRIMTGESTFLIECMETASVLQHATQESLVLLDELGRGTSTFDGYAIAYAVFRHLIEKVHCRLLFATHYHPLTKEFASHPRVSLQHMACSFKSKSCSSKDDEELVFLYRLTSGACPESYGLQVALMAGIPREVVAVASKASQAMKQSIGQSFKSSECRSEFSSLHEEWLKTLLAVARAGHCSLADDDVFDTLLCLWHELKSLYCL